MKLPAFTIDLARRKALSDQLTEGLRRAILTGYYKEGDVLPPVRTLAKHFGVSLIVSCEAVRRLTDEGLVNPRPHIGSMVAPKRAKLWKGRVLLIRLGEYGAYYQNVFEGGLGERLAKEDYLLSSLVLTRREGRVTDWSRLDFLLREKPDFVLQMYDDAATSARLRKAGLKFAVVCEGAQPKGSVGAFRQDRFATVAELAARCSKVGVKSVIQVGAEPHPDSLAVFRSFGISAVERVFPAQADYGIIEGVERAALAAFDAHFARGRKHLPALFLFTDDFFAQGALTALLANGIRVPEDVFAVTLSNKGLGPVFPKTLARFEMDGFAHGVEVAGRIVDCLKGLPVSPLVLSAKYIPGETFPF